MTRSIATTSLEDIAMLSLEFGRLLMECGASALVVDEIVQMVARGLGADRVELRIGYASLAVTVRIRGEEITRMRKVDALGVNQRLDYSVRELARAVGRGDLTATPRDPNLKLLPKTHSAIPAGLWLLPSGWPAPVSVASWDSIGLRLSRHSSPPPSANGSAVNQPHANLMFLSRLRS